MQILVAENDGELVAAYSEHGAVLERLAYRTAGGFEIYIALFVTETVVDHFEVVAVENAYRKSHGIGPAVDLLLYLVYDGGKRALVFDARQRVDEDLLVQTAYVVFHVDRQAFERLCQIADLVVFVVIEREIVIFAVDFFSRFGELLDRLDDAFCENHHKHHGDREYQGGYQHDVDDQSAPVAFRFINGNGDVEAHTVAERQPRRYSFHAFKGVLDERAFAERAVGQDRLVFFVQLRNVYARMIEEISVFVV